MKNQNNILSDVLIQMQISLPRTKQTKKKNTYPSHCNWCDILYCDILLKPYEIIIDECY